VKKKRKKKKKKEKKRKEKKGKKGKKKKEKRKRTHPPSSFSLVSSSRTKSRHPRCVTVEVMRRTFWRHIAETIMFRIELVVPVMHLTRSPFAFSKGKQDIPHRGPKRRTHRGR